MFSETDMKVHASKDVHQESFNKIIISSNDAF